MDLTTAKSAATALWPPRAKEGTATRLVPIISPLEVRSLHLFGIPLVSAMADPITKQRAVMTDDIIRVLIQGAIEQVEADLKITLMPTTYNERQAFDSHLYAAWGHMQLTRRPVWSIASLRFEAANGQALYTIPLDWVDVGKLYRGQISIVPFTIGFTQTGPVPPISGINGSAFLNIIGLQSSWVSAFWTIEYAAGFQDGMLPRIVNEIVGVRTAIEILGQLGATYASTNSTSISVDGISQSVSTPGPNIYAVRIEALEAKYQKLRGTIKSFFGLQITCGTL